MMFGPKHYVPILRWKRAESAALRLLGEADRAFITPLIELTPKSFAARVTKDNELKIPDPDEVLARVAKAMRISWWLRPLFVDLGHLDRGLRVTDGAHPMMFLAERARDLGVPLLPVTGLQRPSDYQLAVSSVIRLVGNGACVRLFLGDIQSPTFQPDLQALMNQLGLSRECTDLLVDCQVATEEAPDWARVASLIPDIPAWRTFTVASGAFPRDLSGMPVGQHQLKRRDWTAWFRHVSSDSRLSRLPAYSDYTIQHAHYSEPPERANFSASIRYATDEHWLIMRGEGVFNEDGPGFAQWPANAQLLRERSEFRGRNFSFGDQYIFDMADRSTKTGTAETWLRAGINHHMTLVARQIANLTDF